VAVDQLRVLHRVHAGQSQGKGGASCHEGACSVCVPSQRWPRPRQSCTGCQLSRRGTGRARQRTAAVPADAPESTPRRVTTLYTVRSKSCCLSTGWVAQPRRKGAAAEEVRPACGVPTRAPKLAETQAVACAAAAPETMHMRAQLAPDTRKTWSGAACLAQQRAAQHDTHVRSFAKAPDLPRGSARPHRGC
jgi:hypothetical protein